MVMASNVLVSDVRSNPKGTVNDLITVSMVRSVDKKEIVPDMLVPV